MTAAIDSTLVEQRHGAVLVLSFNRPTVSNALTEALARRFVAALDAAGRDSEVAAVVVTGSGNRAFCAGVDLDESSRRTAAEVASWFGAIAGCYRAVLMIDKPLVSALNGVAAGAGFQIALVSDQRVGCPATRMCQPEVKAGLPSIMGSYFMTLHLPWSLNQELSYSGRVMAAEECRRLGLINRFAPAEDLLETALDTARKLAAIAPSAFRHTKKRFRELALAGFDEAFAAAVDGMEASYASGEAQARMQSFIARRGR